MDVVKMLDDAKAAGVTVEVNGDGLLVEGPTRCRAMVKRLQEYRSQILAHLNGECETEEPFQPIEKPTPFPVETLPGVVARYVQAAATAIGCPPSFVALPMLAALARAVGNKRVIRLKRTWTEPAVVWAAIVGKSGTHKTPALNEVLRFLQQRQAAAITEYQEGLEKHEQDKALYDRDLLAWKKLKNSTEPPPWPPETPVCERYLTSDATIEALAMMLGGQFDGVLVSRDELAGWLGGIAEYKGGKGSDLGHWLACWSAQSMTVDRKTGAQKMIHVPRAAVSLVGGIQPGVLRQAIGREHLQDGLCARLLLAWPEPREVRWSEATVDAQTEAAMGEVFDRLFGLEPAADAEGKPEPYPLDLTPEGKEVWIEFYNRHRAELVDLDDDLAAAWSKLEAYAARFALLFQLASRASGEASGEEIDQTSVENAVRLADWFGGQAKRVYGLFVETAEDRDRRELVDLIQKRGGVITPRELTNTIWRFKKVADGEAALNGLVQAGLGAFRVVKTATKPRREFTLSTVSTYTNSRFTGDSGENVYVDDIDRQKTHTLGAGENGKPD